MLASKIVESLQNWPLGIDAACMDDGVTSLSSRQVISCVGKFKDDYLAMGVRQNSTVTMTTNTGVEFWLRTIALWCIGAITVPIDAALSTQIDSTQLRHSFDWQDPRIKTFVPPGLDNTKNSRMTRSELRTSNPANPLAHPLSDESGETCTILFTSGSTGTPKQVNLTGTMVYRNAISTSEAIKFSSGCLLASAVPFRYVSALSNFLMAILTGIPYSCRDGVSNASELCDYLLKVSPQAFAGSPTHAQWISDAIDSDHPYSSQLKRIKLIISAGGPFSNASARKLFQNIEGCRLVIAYGMTEVGGKIACRSIDQTSPTLEEGNVGRPIPGTEVATTPVSEDENEGELLVRDGFVVPLDLYENSGAFTHWIATGDRASIKSDGSIIIHGRSDETFKLSGVKIHAKVILAALLATRDFVDAAVIPVRHKTCGHVPHAYVVMKDTLKNASSGTSIIRKLRQVLPTSHMPWRIHFVADIPRTGSGKVDRRALLGRTTSCANDGELSSSVVV